eukprot:2575639-Prymnesium_polylepis.1
MSGWDNLEGKNKRTGARVVENAKLRQPPPPRAGPRRLLRLVSCACWRVAPCAIGSVDSKASSTSSLG